MYDKKGRKSYNSGAGGYSKLIEANRLKKLEKLKKVKEAKEREIALQVPETSLVKARRPTKNAPTQAEQDRSKFSVKNEDALSDLKGWATTDDMWSTN